MTDCIHCGATDEAQHNITIRIVDELNQTACDICVPQASSSNV